MVKGVLSRSLRVSPLSGVERLGEGRFRLTSRVGVFDLSGVLPCGWTDIAVVLSTTEPLNALPRLVVDGLPVVPLSLPKQGQIRAIVRLPDQVGSLRLELSVASDLQLGSFTVRNLSAAEAALRLAAPLIQSRLGEPQLLPTMARKLVRALHRGGPRELLEILLAKRRHQARPPYGDWVARFTTLSEADRTAIRAAIAAMVRPPRFSVLMPVYETPEPFLRRAIESVRTQLYPHWELCIADDASRSPHVRRVLDDAAKSDGRIKVVFRPGNGHIAAASNSALTLATGDWTALLDHDDELAEHALYMLATEAHHADLVYSDEDKIDAHGRLSEPHFKPDWNPDLAISHNYVGHLCAIRAATVRELGGFRVGFEGSQDHDLVLRVARGGARIRHVPHVLYHWRAVEGSTALSAGAKEYAEAASVRALRDHTGMPVERGILPLTYRVRWPVPQPPPLISLIIPTRDARRLLEKCIDTLRQRTEYPAYEIVIVDNQSRDEKTLRYLQELQDHSAARVVRYDRPFNYSAINNLGVRNARGPIVGLLNNDLEIVDGGWLGEMVAQALRREVGVVGAKLLYPDGSIQHGGVILGVGGVAGHAHKHLPADSHGYFSRAQVAQNLSAVTAACLVIRREVYEQVGGFDESLAVAFNDVDFCLRVREAGFRNVWTPHAMLVHHESKTRGVESTREKQQRFRREMEFMLSRWGEILRNDPAYNPNLTLDSEDFALAWPTRMTRPWD